ncbi:ABC transporter, substrate-binding protein (cluster 5, nickel/peptides/opines) [hydrothermal vent metagenome]|uniref:ABC transporter, substrate-binding protein (Cluster 5, nickel/peptides/opines) n=1 Tax=hydrothermal vent metagenome TaxID=652676 RepID=A0A3B0TQX5_9ZZZZ
MKLGTALIAAAFLTTTIATAGAQTLRWARAGDSLTLDPHAQNEGPTHTLAHQMYEPLLHRDMAGQIVPALATEWGPTDDPNVWEFKLRQGVKFHDGADFTAEDVVMSFNRARMPDSNMKELLASVTEIRAVGDYVVQIVTDGPNPILPSNLTNLFIMDKGWVEKNGVQKPQDTENAEETYAVRNTNGTGAYMLVSREPDTKTVLKQNPNYWGQGQFPLQVKEIIYTPIQNAATRVAALLSGEVDYIQDVPVQDLGRVAATAGLAVRTAPQNRVIFFGLNQGGADLKTDNIEGKNPFADVRVRQAMNIAIDRNAIKKVVMRDQSQPAGVIMPPFVNGWTKELDAVPATDIAKAKGLMADAGYGDGFSVQLDCPNDRYINDEAICQAAVGMMGKIGIKVRLDAKPKALHFPLIRKLETDFYMLGWGVPTFDSEYIFNFLIHSRGEKYGSWNGTGFADAELDKKIEALASETDLAKRNASIAEIWKVVQENTIYLPIHHQVLNWGMKDNIEFDVQPEDQPHFKYLKYKS